MIKSDLYKRFVAAIRRKNMSSVSNNFSDIKDLIFSPIKNPRIEGNSIKMENIRLCFSSKSKK
tara:strand:+ start:802 stop:990 length:189 start_codon:yes stop_codon:yes gene_type:complete